jgi:hypothetical protein
MSAHQEERNGNGRERDAFGTPGLVEAAMRRGVRDALLRHKLLGESIAVSRDGKVVIVPADEIVVPELPEEQPDT